MEPGFFVSKDGKVVTNQHVIEKCQKVIWVNTTDGQEGRRLGTGDRSGK